MTTTKILELLKNRYFRPVIAHPAGCLGHHGDCHVFRAMEMHGTAPCTCGFLHDLRVLPETIKLKLWPRFYEELSKEDGPTRNPIPPEELEKFWAAMGQHFKMPEAVPPEEEEKQDKEDWQIIRSVFGDYTNFLKKKP